MDPQDTRVPTTGIAPIPSGLPKRLVLETPGWAAFDVRADPAAVARRCSSRAKSRLASLDWPYAVDAL